MAFQTLNVYFLLENCIGVVWVETEVRFKLRFFEEKKQQKTSHQQSSNLYNRLT